MVSTGSSEPFVVREASGPELPIVLSVPHCGIAFPQSLADDFHPSVRACPIDTDWFVHELYDFAPALGITLVSAHYSRYVIDLNRNPEGHALYSDGRSETSLVPTRTFAGQPLFREGVAAPGPESVKERLEAFYWPYYRKLDELLAAKQRRFKHVLLWDAHSIKKHVPTIRKEPFADFILGNQNGQTADERLINTALRHLGRDGQFSLAHNEPFKGGQITRHFGKPQSGRHALQLEMSQSAYMDEEKAARLPERAERVRGVLRPLLLALAEELKKLP